MEKNGSSSRENRVADAMARAARLCSRQERSSGQIRSRLTEWGLGEQQAETVIRKLKEEKYLDDNRFAHFYARDKFRFNRWGKVKIAHALRQQRIEETAIEEALEQLDGQEYYQACKEVVRSKAKGLKETNPFARKGKLFRHASGKGYESELIYRVLSEIEGE